MDKKLQLDQKWTTFHVPKNVGTIIWQTKFWKTQDVRRKKWKRIIIIKNEVSVKIELLIKNRNVC